MGFGNKQEKLNNYDVSWYESYPLCHFLKMNTRKGGILWNSFVKITRGGLQNFTHETFFSEKKQHIILIFFFDWSTWQARWQGTAEKTAGVRHDPSLTCQNTRGAHTSCSSSCWSDVLLSQNIQQSVFLEKNGVCTHNAQIFWVIKNKSLSG